LALLLSGALVACTSTTAGTAVLAPTETAGTTATAPHVITEPSSPPGTQTTGKSAAGSGSTQATAPLAGTSAAPIPSGLEKYYTQKLQWEGCLSYITSSESASWLSLPTVRCAHLAVPLDYSKPDGPMVTMAVTVQPSTSSNPIGALVIDPGGPGDSGLLFGPYVGFVDPSLRRNFDLIGIDPRGVGASVPAISCESDAEKDADRVANWIGSMPTSTQAEIDAANDRTKKYVQGCLDGSGANGVTGSQFLQSVGTVTVAKDLDVLRAVLGDSKLSYLGFSYGTSIGTQYAEQFSSKVRALLLDAAVDPNQSAADSELGQDENFQKAFETFAKDCVARQGCALGSDPAKATAVFQQMTRPLMTRPVPLSDGRTLSYSDAVWGTSEAMYDNSLWADLRAALSQLATGNGDGMMALADQYYQRDTNGKYANLFKGSFDAIRCMDNDRITDPKVQVEHNKQAQQIAPFSDNGQPAAAVFDVCTYWPFQPTMTPHVPDPKGLPTVLVMSTTGDPATPYQNGVNLAKYLDARLLTVEGTRHGAFLSGKPCVDQIGNDYLINLKLPPEGAKCS
jgi:pimeloyl-ACP methyl ester carboxylesterase